MPLMIMWYICEVPYLKGRRISWFIITFYVLFVYLTVFNLTVLTMDRFGAIVHGLRYHSWKTTNKAKVAVLFVWLLAAGYTYGMFTLGLDIDVGDAPFASTAKRLSTFCSVAKQAKSDVKTAKTIGVTVLAFFCMGVVPMLLHSIARIHGSWPHFLAFFLMHMNSMVSQSFLAVPKEPFGKSQPDMTSKNQKATRNLTCKTEEHDIYNTYL
ncbi:hypothetical protein OS493_007986 [Desmophyllum pertusum]|uniref:G-protein coupled receptors family 1 profile domain-containing protein n=1 Tax=Desmophyllum pertusum TaxID=174260 RepID=A0A9W9YI23_9CNID|nr:hypothetical protein OS493_007986 [Desmophyllum pertusum]